MTRDEDHDFDFVTYTVGFFGGCVGGAFFIFMMLALTEHLK